MADIQLDYGTAEVVQEHDLGRNPNFYSIPAEATIDAGAQRGPAPISIEQPISFDETILVGQEEPSESPSQPPVEDAADIRLDTLHIQGHTITQLSTSRLFAYVSHFGAQPLGLEWIDDKRCNIVFSNEESARLGHEYLSPPTTDMETLPPLQHLLQTSTDLWDVQDVQELVTPRRAHRIPTKLYTAIEKQAAIDLHNETSNNETDNSHALPDDVPEIYREMEEADRRVRLEKPEFVALAKLRSPLWVRFAVKGVDVKESRASKNSQWYREHGYEAGREIVPKLLDVGEIGQTVELFPERKNGQKPVADVANQIRGRGQTHRQAMMDQLDSEMDAHVASRDPTGESHYNPINVQDQEQDLFSRLKSKRRDDSSFQSRWTHDAFEADEHRTTGQGRGRRQANGRTTTETLDQELQDLHDARQRQRSASPGRLPDIEVGQVKIKGRGRMKAPGSTRGWNSHDQVADERWSNLSNDRSATQTGRGNRRDRWTSDNRDHSSVPSLASKLDGSNHDDSDKPRLLNRLGNEPTKSLADRFG